MPLPQTGDLQWADPMNGYLTDLKNEADITSSDLGDHLVASDPHGSLTPASANATSQITAHSTASDPHGDRADTTNRILAHAQQQDAHGDRADATGKLNAHISASDPHGTRAFVDSMIVPSTITGNGLGWVFTQNPTTGSVATPQTWQENSGSTNCFVQLQVPASGKLVLAFGFAGWNTYTSGSITAAYIQCAPALTYLTYVPGSVDLPPQSSNAVYVAGPGTPTTSVWRIIAFSGLKPGPIQIELWYYSQGGDSTTTRFENQWILATPIPI